MSENMKGGFLSRISEMYKKPPVEEKPEEKIEFKTYTRKQLEEWKDFFTKNETLFNEIVKIKTGSTSNQDAIGYNLSKYSGYIDKLLNNDGDPIYDTERYLDKIDIFITKLNYFISTHKRIIREGGGKRRSKKKSSKRKSKRKSSKKGRKSRRKRRTRK